MELVCDVGADDALDPNPGRVGLADLEQLRHGPPLRLAHGVVALLHHAQPRNSELELHLELCLRGEEVQWLVSGSVACAAAFVVGASGSVYARPTMMVAEGGILGNGCLDKL